jgi:hypothetical protein
MHFNSSLRPLNKNNQAPIWEPDYLMITAYLQV